MSATLNPGSKLRGINAARIRAIELLLPLLLLMTSAMTTEQSVRDQQAIEGSDRIPFETFRQQYISAERLALSTSAIAPALATV